MDQDNPIIDEDRVRLHGNAGGYAVAVNAAIAEQLDGKHPYPAAGGALWRLGADTVAFHQAVLALCDTGWASCSAPILRTLLDLLISTAIIVERKDEAEIRGFRCTHFFLKAALSDSSIDDKVRKDSRQQIDSGIAQLSDTDKDRARRFVFQDPVRAYWYAPDYFHRPQEAVDKLLGQELGVAYARLSSAAHGGFVGLGLFRDQPDTIHPNQRDDPQSESMALLISTRIVLEQTRARNEFELGGQFSGTYGRLLDRLLRLPSPLLHHGRPKSSTGL